MIRNPLLTRRCVLQQVTGAGALAACGTLLAACGASSFGAATTTATTADAMPARPSVGLLPTMQPTPLVATPTAGPALTLRQAWQLALQQARNWSADAAVASVSSIDQPGSGVSIEHTDAGATGTRALWEVTLIAPSKPSSQLWIRLDYGKVVQRTIQPRSVLSPAMTTPPALDSSDAIKAALAAKPPLAPAAGKSHGYAYTLYARPDGRAVLAVVGALRGMPAKVEFDAITGKKLGASVYTFSQGGILYSAAAGQTWHASNLVDKFVPKIAAIPNRPDAAYAIGVTTQAVTIARTANGGRTWAPVGNLPEVAGSSATDLAVGLLGGGAVTLAAAMPTGLWLSTDGGSSWVHNTALPSGAVQWVAATTDASGGRLLASIASLSSPEHAGVYTSADGTRWRQVLPTTCRLSPVNGGRGVVALEDGGSTAAHLIEGTTATPLTLSVPALRVAGTVAAGSPLLADSAGALALSTDGGRDWTTVLRKNTTSIAVAPTAGSGSIALAGGFRTGIFRSSDGGRTWMQVVGDVSTILPGSDEVVSITFLSASHVVAMQGATQSWQPV